MQGLMPVPGQSDANIQTQILATSAVAMQGLMPIPGQSGAIIQMQT
jgi:hypothetical protein